MILNKWNSEKHEYEDYEIPIEWNTPLFTEDMSEVVNCVQCGKEVEYGKCYTSLEVHNNYGLGFAVCEHCYDEEYKRRMIEREQNENN